MPGSTQTLPPMTRYIWLKHPLAIDKLISLSRIPETFAPGMQHTLVLVYFPRWIFPTRLLSNAKQFYGSLILGRYFSFVILELSSRILNLCCSDVMSHFQFEKLWHFRLKPLIFVILLLAVLLIKCANRSQLYFIMQCKTWHNTHAPPDTFSTPTIAKSTVLSSCIRLVEAWGYAL